MLVADGLKVVFQYSKHGNKTTCLLKKRGSDEVLAYGKVLRYSKDTPDRRVARKYALKHALENSKLPKNERTEIWKRFWSKARRPV